MNIEAAIQEAVAKAINPAILNLNSKIEELQNTIKDLTRHQGETLTINAACDLLKISRKTFNRHRHHIVPAGGSLRNIVYYKSDVLGLREKIRQSLD